MIALFIETIRASNLVRASTAAAAGDAEPDADSFLTGRPGQTSQSVARPTSIFDEWGRLMAAGASIDEASRVSGQSTSLIKVNIHRGLKKIAAMIVRDYASSRARVIGGSSTHASTERPRRAS